MTYLQRAATLLCLLLAAVAIARAQSCAYSISGKVVNSQGLVLSGALIRLSAGASGVVADTDGRFVVTRLCAGSYTVVCDFPGYRDTSIALSLTADTSLQLVLAVDEHQLGAVVVSAAKQPALRTIAYTELKGLALLQTRGGTLGDALKELPGLNAIQTGPTLSKPVIHGLHSNRVLIINNGVRQEGQQWGSEHAPEIDPFIAGKITIVKGAASVRYGADAIGGVVLLEPADMPVKQGISGDLYLVGATNGRMGVASGMLQGSFGKVLSGLSWRVQGTLRRAGNFKAPGYYLINTGIEEADGAVALCYKKNRFDVDLFYSTYNNKLGIFTGAESGSVAELQQKFAQATPALPSYFTYAIGRPFQSVSHTMLRLRAAYDLAHGNKLELTIGRQVDSRKEYDYPAISKVPLDPAIPQLSFQLITHTAELVYTQHTSHGFSGSFGFSGSTSGNVFQGIRYLIPNFRDYNGGAFAIERYTLGRFTFESGLRYDYRWLQVYQRNATTLALYNTTYVYNNITGTAGSTYRFNSHLSASFNVGTAWRTPSINEMYVNGQHFSDASYQVGDSALHSERSLNAGLSVTYRATRLRAVADVYYNKIGNYIYAKPSLRVRQLAGGSFPEFLYTQANVHIRGLDLSVQYDLLPRLTFRSGATIVRGYNESAADWLIFMPGDRFENGLVLHLPGSSWLQQFYVSVSNVSVLRQVRVPPASDFVPPPAGYSLFNANTGCTLPLRHNTLDVNFAITNIANIAYRDYLDHFRYYADQLGINYVLRLKYSF